MTLSVSDLSVAVGGRTLVSGLSFELEGAGRIALVGPSGVGKTMILRAIAHLDDPAGGRVTLDGVTPEELGYPVYRRRVSYVSQRPVLFAGTVMENLRRPFRLEAVSADFPEEEARGLLSRLRLDSGALPDEARDLSEGQKQRVALVRALAPKPDVLLLDEPTSGLDAESTEAVESLIAEREVSVLWVTHDRAQAERACHRTIELGAANG